MKVANFERRAAFRHDGKPRPLDWSDSQLFEAEKLVRNAETAGTAMIKHPTKGELMTQAAFEAESDLRQEAQDASQGTISSFNFWSFPLTTEIVLYDPNPERILTPQEVPETISILTHDVVQREVALALVA